MSTMQRYDLILSEMQTTLSFLVLVTVSLDPSEQPYQSPYLNPSAARHFLPGPGEALPMHSISLQLEGAIHIEGTLLRCIDMQFCPL